MSNSNHSAKFINMLIALMASIAIALTCIVPTALAEDGDGTDDNNGGSTVQPAGPVPNIIITNFTYGGDSVAAGADFNLDFTFQNMGQVAVTNMVITVDGGESFASSVLITDQVMQAVEDCTPLAPLHNPANIIGIEACRKVLGDDVPQVAVFDTAFHQTMPPQAYLYGLPYRYFEELGVRRVQLNAFTPPAGVRQRYQLAAWLAGHLAFEIAQWHEIAQWYGFQSVPGFSEEISAFSPEDLYSNLLGARLAINVILSGHGGSLEDYNQAMDAALKQVLTRLLVATRGETEAMFQQIDGDWWNSHRRVPDKFLVLKRNYDLQENRLPTPVPFETMPPYRLTMPEQVGGFRLRDLGELQIYPGHDMQALPVPAQYYGAGAFQGLADRAHEADKTQLARTEK